MSEDEIIQGNKKVAKLLKPRYKVIADYPGSEWKVGTVFSVRYMKVFYDAYPHLFKPLEWWEERKESDMPQFVKSKLDNTIHEVGEWLLINNGFHSFRS